MNKKKLLSGPYFVWMILFTIIPLLVIAWYGFTDRTGAFTLANVRAIASPEHLKALGLSLSLSIACTILCLLIAYPLAMILKKTGMGKKGFVVFIFILPMWMNFLLRTYAWLNLLDDGGILFNICRNLGLPTFSVVGTMPGIISGITMVFVPSLTTFAISDLLGARKIMLIGNIIEQEFSTADNWHLGSGLSLVLMVFILISMAVLEHYDKNGEGTSF